MTYQVGQLTYSVFPSVADPGMLGDNEVQRIESFPAAETIYPGRALLMTSGSLVEQAQGTRSDTTTVLDVYGFSILRTAREGLGQENDSATAGGAAYVAGDMVPVLRRGCLYAEWKGTTIPAGGPTYTSLNVYQSSTVATDRGKVTDAAASQTATSEVGPLGGRVRVKPVLPALSNTGNIILLDISFPRERSLIMERFDLADFVTPATLTAMSGQRFDTADTAIFLRQLTDVYEQTYDIKYPDLKARSFIPVDSRVNPGAESFLWRQFDRRGVARIVDGTADDFPNVEVIGKEYQGRIYSGGVSYQYTLQDLRAASMAGLPLETRKANTARRVMEELVEKIACDGMVRTNAPVQSSDAIPVYGLVNNPNILQGGSSGYTTLNWLAAGTTVAQILADVNALQATIFNTSLGVHKPDTLLLPTPIYSFLATTPRSPTFTDDTMLQYILKQSPWLKQIEYWNQLDSVGKKQDTTTAGGRVLMYEKSPENMQLVIPQEFEQLPPQLIKMSFVIPCHMRIGGVTVRYPKSVAYLDGTGG